MLLLLIQNYLGWLLILIIFWGFDCIILGSCSLLLLQSFRFFWGKAWATLPILGWRNPYGHTFIGLQVMVYACSVNLRLISTTHLMICILIRRVHKGEIDLATHKSLRKFASEFWWERWGRVLMHLNPLSLWTSWWALERCLLLRCTYSDILFVIGPCRYASWR